MAAPKSENQFTLPSSLKIQKITAWTLLVFGWIFFAAITTNEAQAPDAPPSPLDVIWTVALLGALPLLWLRRINESQKQKRYLSSKGVIITVIAIISLITLWTFYRDAQKYFVYQDELTSQKFAAVNIVFEKRFSLVPNVGKSASALASQERSIISDIAQARAAYLRGQSVDNKVAAINDFNRALTAISINAENYPDLKSDKGFLELIDVMEKTENQLADVKNDYNKQVTTLNTQSRTIPYNLLAGSFIDDPVKTRIDGSVDPQTLDSKQLLEKLN